MAALAAAALVLSDVATAQQMQLQIPVVAAAEPLPDAMATAEVVVQAL